MTNFEAHNLAIITISHMHNGCMHTRFIGSHHVHALMHKQSLKLHVLENIPYTYAYN